MTYLVTVHPPGASTYTFKAEDFDPDKHSHLISFQTKEGERWLSASMPHSIKPVPVEPATSAQAQPALASTEASVVVWQPHLEALSEISRKLKGLNHTSWPELPNSAIESTFDLVAALNSLTQYVLQYHECSVQKMVAPRYRKFHKGISLVLEEIRRQENDVEAWRIVISKAKVLINLSEYTSFFSYKDEEAQYKIASNALTWAETLLLACELQQTELRRPGLEEAGTTVSEEDFRRAIGNTNYKLAATLEAALKYWGEKAGSHAAYGGRSVQPLGLENTASTQRVLGEALDHFRSQVA